MKKIVGLYSLVKITKNATVSNEDRYWRDRRYNEALMIVLLVLLGVSLGVLVSAYFS